MGHSKDISLVLAARYSGFPQSFFIKQIKLGNLRPVYPLISKEQNPVDYQYIIRLPLESLPRYAAEAYLKDYYAGIEFIHLDLLRIKELKGDSGLEGIYNDMNTIREVERIRRDYPLCSTAKIQSYLSSLNLPLSSYYRKERMYMASDAAKLLKISPAYKTKQLCLLSQNFAAYMYGLPNHPFQNDILKMLMDEAWKHGADICGRCPFNPASTNHKDWLVLNPDSETCTVSGKGMIVPSTRYPLNRFFKTIPQEVLYYHRFGPNAWEAYFASKTTRDKVTYANEVWYGDHVLADVIVIVKQLDNGTVITARPWITVFTDAASNAIVGSVISLRANSKTIMECFCRAVVFTVDSPFFGCPRTIYVDNGKDYRSEMLKGIDPEDRQKLPAGAIQLNDEFSENNLLKQLQVHILHAKKRSGRSKVIENTFGIITPHWFRSIPGWCGSNPKERPFDFEKEKKRLIKTGQLWTLEKFSRYWFEVIVPEYNHTVFSNNGARTVSTPETPSPVDRYLSLPKISNLVPDWESLAVLKERSPKEYAVYDNGIHYNNDVYWHPSLQALKTARNEPKKYVSVYDFDQTFCHSITIAYNNKFLCEAEPLVHHKTIEEDRYKLALHLEEQKKEKKNVSRIVALQKQSLKKAGIKPDRYTQYNPEPYEESPIYTERVDEDRNRTETTQLSSGAAEYYKLAKARETAIDRILYDHRATPLQDYLQELGAKNNET